MPSIPQAVLQAYRDLAHAFRTLWPLPGIVFLVLAANTIIQDMIVLRYTSGGVRDLVVFLIGAAQQFLITPYYLAVHRLIIRDEAVRSYRLEPNDLAFQRFFWLSLAFDVLFFLPSQLAPMLGPARSTAP